MKGSPNALDIDICRAKWELNLKDEKINMICVMEEVND